MPGQIKWGQHWKKSSFVLTFIVYHLCCWRAPAPYFNLKFPLNLHSELMQFSGSCSITCKTWCDLNEGAFLSPLLFALMLSNISLDLLLHFRLLLFLFRSLIVRTEGAKTILRAQSTVLNEQRKSWWQPPQSRISQSSMQRLSALICLRMHFTRKFTSDWSTLLIEVWFLAAFACVGSA